jgi:short-subunit dehydrogenase
VSETSTHDRPLALITGACSGIGKALAQQLALRGYGLVVVSNRAQPLAETAAEIRATSGAPVHEVVMDLARAEAAEELLQTVRAAGHQIEVLVNNAGIFFFGEVADTDPVKARALLHLHVLTPSLLCTHFGREMRARGSGHILIVSSLSAWRDFPGIAYYGSSKKYLRGFARALRSELSVYGVNVTCLAPGATFTGLYSQTSATVARGRRLKIIMEADAVARSGLRAMFARQAECMPGLLNRVLALLSMLTPQWIIDLVRRRAPWLPPRKNTP